MRAGIATVVMLLLCALPAAALAAKPVPAWPSAHDLIQAEPGLRTADAACIARYYHGRLSRKAWFTLYYDLTDKQKVVTDAGPVHCMTLRERVAMDQRLYASVVGAHPQLHCVAVATEPATNDSRLGKTCGRPCSIGEGADNGDHCGRRTTTARGYRPASGGAAKPRRTVRLR